jgi:hypothetical protein
MSSTPVSINDVPPRALLSAIEDQRLGLLNVLGGVHCMSEVMDGNEDRIPEFGAAFQLLEQEIRRIVMELEETSLRNAGRLIAGKPVLHVSPAKV